MDYKVRYFNNSQFHEYTNFLKSFLGQDYSTEMFVGDKWWENYNKSDRFIFFAFNDQEVAARCSISERKLIYDGEIIKCFEIGGTYTFPNHQRKGLFSRLVNTATELGLSLQAKLIYGTPNEQSGPGYKKLGYSFVDTKNSFLIYVPKIIRVALKKKGLFREQEIENIKHEGTLESFGKRYSINEITLDEYIKITKKFTRMNFSNEGYLRSRFGKADIVNRRFFKGQKGKLSFCCTLRNYHLQYLRPVMVSEYFLDGKRDDGFEKYCFLKLIASKYYRGHDGIYLKAKMRTGSGKYFDTLKHKCFKHRSLPVCYSSSLPASQVKDMMDHIVDFFQLTDCDIG